MPSTYTLIKGETIGSAAASYTFTAIPSTFTDLVVRMSGRTSYGGEPDTLSMTLNSDSGSTYSYTDLRGDGSSASSARASSISGFTYINNALTTSATTSNTFGNLEIYIPSYTVSQNKPIGSFGVAEKNSTEAFMAVGAELWRNTATITTIGLTSANGSNFVSGSSFYLYGISKS